MPLVPAKPPDLNPKKPKLQAPPGACDTHFHLFGPAAKYPFGFGEMGDRKRLKGGWGEIRKRDGIKGKQLSEVRLTVKLLEQGHE